MNRYIKEEPKKTIWDNGLLLLIIGFIFAFIVGFSVCDAIKVYDHQAVLDSNEQLRAANEDLQYLADSGYERGYHEGYDEGYEVGINEQQVETGLFSWF